MDMVTRPSGGPGWEIPALGKIGPQTEKRYPEAVWKEFWRLGQMLNYHDMTTLHVAVVFQCEKGPLRLNLMLHKTILEVTYNMDVSFQV